MMEQFYTTDTVLNADCVAWCPHPDRQHLVLCSTYELINGRRTGSLLLYSMDTGLCLQQAVVNMQGIFDFKWSPSSYDPIMVAAADSKGNVTFLRLDLTSNLLIPAFTAKVADSMALYIDWLGSQIVVSLSDGTVILFEIGQNDLIATQTYKTHSLEAWAAVFDVNERNVMYSGGDDCLMALYDMRNQQVASKNHYHTAGVTYFLTSKHLPNYFTSGSYDELICKWDRRNMKSPIHELGLGGGVWRIQMENNSNPKLAVACMFQGFKFLEIGADGFKEIGKFRNEEDCLAYGVGLSQNNEIAMCTFYDHTLYISKGKLNDII